MAEASYFSRKMMKMLLLAKDREILSLKEEVGYLRKKVDWLLGRRGELEDTLRIVDKKNHLKDLTFHSKFSYI